MFFLLATLWFIRTTKSILFWLYLWQLKEYYLYRFLDHFRTEKGKKIFLNFLFLFKILLAFAFIFLKQKFLIFLLIFLYFGETLIAIKNFFQKNLKLPVFTKKIIFLTFLALIFEISIIINLAKTVEARLLQKVGFCLLIVDILIPLIISLLVLFFQPFFIFLKNQIIKKATKKREKFKDLLVIGITGSYGKTSTKEFLAEILAEKYRVLKTKENQNTEIGVARSILENLNSKDQIFICEMAAYKKGEIKAICDIVKPKIGILTGINEQHLATFGSLENIIKTKYELIENLPEDGLAIFNGNNKYCLKLYQKTKIFKKNVKLLNSKSNINNKIAQNVILADIWAEIVKIKRDSIFFKVFSKEREEAEFKLNLIGAQNIENILLAICCAKYLGMSLSEIAKACQKIRPEQGGIVLKKGKNNLNIIDSTYSANPSGVISHLDYLKVWPGKKAIVMPCLIELSKASKEIHYKIGKKIGKVCDLAIIVTKERFKEIKKGALEGGLAKENILFLEKPKEILEKISSFLKQKEDVVLLEGRISKEIIEKLIL